MRVQRVAHLIVNREAHEPSKSVALHEVYLEVCVHSKLEVGSSEAHTLTCACEQFVRSSASVEFREPCASTSCSLHNYLMDTLVGLVALSYTECSCPFLTAWSPSAKLISQPISVCIFSSGTLNTSSLFPPAT
eukprot:scaffold311034_cov22-Tisochrysis_lutea.AAC.1